MGVAEQGSEGGPSRGWGGKQPRCPPEAARLCCHAQKAHRATSWAAGTSAIPREEVFLLSLLAKEELGGSRAFVVILGFVFILFLVAAA